VSAPDSAKFYSREEEHFNIASHALGLVLSVAALIALVQRALVSGGRWHLLSVSVFALTMIALYAASTTYHATREPRLRAQLRTLDHATIYLLIAGTYTPFALVTLSGAVGWTIFAIVWGMAASGIVLKLFFTGRFKLVSTLVYLLMGWLILLFINPMIERFPVAGLAWLLAGGIAYTLGALAYSVGRLAFNHAIFHVCVLFGSACHFVAIYRYVLPGDA